MLNQLKNISCCLFILFIFSSCVEHKISIIVYPDGSFDYDHSASGDKKDLLDFDFPLPSSIDWIINHNFEEDTEDFNFRAVKHFEVDSEFPQSFSKSDSILHEILLSHQYSIQYSNSFIYENYDIEIIYKGRKSSQKYPVIAEFLRDQDNPPKGWVFDGLSYIFKHALSETDIGFNIEPIVNSDIENWLDEINYNFDNESLQNNFTSIKNEGIEIVKKHLINESIKEFIKLISKFENEARITIDLSDDIIELTTVLPGYLISSNADSSFNDTLLWRFSGIDLIDEDYIISAKTSIYHKSRFHWTILTILLLVASITLYLIARKVPDPMKMSK